MGAKTKILSGILLLSIFLTMGMVVALTINTPTASEIVTGTYTFNVTNGTINSQTLNCTFSTTANTNFAVVKNTTAHQKDFTVANNTALLTETASTTLTVVCTNQTNIAETATLTIGIDNTNPTCSFTKDYDETTYLSPIGVLTTQGSSDTTTLTYAWTLYDPSGVSQTTSTSSAPSFTGTNFDEIGEFTLGLVATDGASLSTSCTNQTIIVRSKDGDAIIPSIISQSFFKENKMPIIIGGIVFVIVLISVVSFVIIGKSK